MGRCKKRRLVSPPPFKIALTGLRTIDGRKQSQLVVVHDHWVYLTHAAFVHFCQLAGRRIGTNGGYLPPLSYLDANSVALTVHRLRRQLDSCFDSSIGMDLIENGMCAHYRLTVPKTEIAVDQTFKELPPGLLPVDLRDFLVANCPEVELEQY